MTPANQDLLAAHKVISVLEKSKYLSDNFLDCFPAIIATINIQGQILKGNEEAGKILKVEKEYLLRKGMSAFFKRDTWKIFENYLLKFSTKKGVPSPIHKLEFELTIDSESLGPSRPFFWQIRPFNYGVPGNEGLLFNVIGTDISPLRRLEREVSEVFTSVPLGILTIDAHGCVEGKYSSYTEYLLKTYDLGGKNIRELIFEPSRDILTLDQKLGVEFIFSAFGKDELYFEEIKKNFPREIERSAAFLGLAYQGIFSEGLLVKILMVIEDRTKVVLAEKEREKNKIIEDKAVGRFLQIKRCDPAILHLIMDEILVYQGQLKASLAARNMPEAGRILHGLKGNANVGGFEHLADLTHELELKLRENESASARDFEEIGKEVEELNVLYHSLSDKKSVAAGEEGSKEELNSALEEVRTFFRRYSHLSEKGPENKHWGPTEERFSSAINILNFSPLEVLEDLIRVQANKCADKLGKKLKMQFFWNGVCADRHTRGELQKCLLHLVNNAIDHGLEWADERQLLGKEEEGKLVVRLEEIPGAIKIIFEDDGRGIDPLKVRDNAIRKGYLDKEKAKSLSPEDLISFIFQSGFSTKETPSQISGMGVGLDAVASIVRKAGGDIRCRPGKPWGTQFHFHYPLQGPASVHSGEGRQLIPYDQFCTLFMKSAGMMKAKEGIRIEFAGENGSGISGNPFVFINLPQVTFALMTLIGQFSLNGDVHCRMEIQGKRVLLEVVRKMDKTLDFFRAPLEYLLPLPICETIVEAHCGRIVREWGRRLLIEFGHIVRVDRDPLLSIGLASEIDLTYYDYHHQEFKRNLENVSDMIRGILEEMDIPFRFDLKNAEAANIYLCPRGPGVQDGGGNDRVYFSGTETRITLRRKLMSALGNILDQNFRDNQDNLERTLVK